MKHELIKYPDGQISVKLTDVSKDINDFNLRINSYEDLAVLLSVAEAAHAQGLKLGTLKIPCLFGQRSDRRFNDNQSFDLKVITDAINHCKFSMVVLFDPHSDVSLGMINNSAKFSPLIYVRTAVNHINSSNLILVSPDAGAYKKVYEFGESLNLPVVSAVKHRDSEGKIDLKFIGDVKGMDCLIVDDLLDGGYTFVQLGKQLKEQGAKNVYLYISHGYFHKGTDQLKKYIDHIYCTNSVKDLPQNDYITQYRII